VADSMERNPTCQALRRERPDRRRIRAAVKASPTPLAL
jgi:hypothetical protein